MSKKIETYNLNGRFAFLRGVVAFLLIAFVLAKPVQALILELSEDKTELSSVDSDQDENEQEDSEEDTEDSEEEEEFDKNNASLFIEYFETSKSNENFWSHNEYRSKFKLGVIVPPPEGVLC